MSAGQQAKAARRKMQNGYAHLGNSRHRPRLSGPGVAEAARRAADKVKK